jgi:trafficking protein particle complex subunit 9
VFCAILLASQFFQVDIYLLPRFRIVLSSLAESAKAYHECTVVFLTPGEYKIDIQCSTTEPVLEDISVVRETDNQSLIQPCAGEVSHTWRFIPPVAISVTD